MGVLLELDETMQVKPSTHLLPWERAHPSGENDTDREAFLDVGCAHTEENKAKHQPST